MRKKALAHAPKLLDPNFGEAYISTAGEVGILNPYKLAPTNPTPITKNISPRAKLEELLSRNGVLDLQGRLIERQSQDLQEGMQSQVYDVQNLAAGTYLLMVSNNGQRSVKRFIVQR